MNKYDITSETRLSGPVTLHRITALRDIPRHGVKAGDLGGWIESERNLSQSDDAWISGDASVWGNASVSGDARVSGDASVWRAQHVLMIGPIGSEDQTFTIYRTEDGGHQVIVGCWGPGTLTELGAEVARRKREYWAGRGEAEIGRWEAQYAHAIRLGEVMAESWAAEHAAKADQ